MKFQVKRRWLFLGLALICVIGGVVGRLCFPEDFAEYQKILDQANPSRTLETRNSYRASQKRKGVEKIFWRSKGKERLKSVLTCLEAELFYEKKGEEQQVLETMKEVHCLVQTDLYYLSDLPWQDVRYMEAASATYCYATKTLEADQAVMKFYSLPGHELPDFTPEEPPLKTAIAEKVALSVVDGELAMDAEKFKGEMCLRKK